MYLQTTYFQPFFCSHIVLVRKGSSLQKAVVPECWLDPNKWCTSGLYKETTQAGPSNKEMLVLILVDVARFIVFFKYSLQGSKRWCRIGPPTTVLLSWNQRMRISLRLNILTMFSIIILNDATRGRAEGSILVYEACCLFIVKAVCCG